MTAVGVSLAVEREVTLRDLIHQALCEDEPDPHVVAEKLIASMDLADARRALEVTLPRYVCDISRSYRIRSPQSLSVSRRWENVAELHASGELALLRLRVFAAGVWKFLGDCTREDVEGLAADRAAEAAANAAAAERFTRLRSAMGKKKAATVRDLPVAVLTEIFNA